MPWKEIARMLVQDVVDNDLDALADAVQSLVDRIDPDDAAGSS